MLTGPAWVQFQQPTGAALTLATAGRVAPLLVDPADHAGVRRAAADLQRDIHAVTGTRPTLLNALPAGPTRQIPDLVVIGTLGASRLVDQLAAQGRIDVSSLRGRWEGFLWQTVDKPWPGVDRALVIAGSDRRGSIYGLYTLSEQIGVSPWHWWADVPVQRHSQLHLPMPLRVEDAPVVRWRGIFLNDEAPALSGWVQQFHGGYTHTFYAKVFELLLRLRANTLWPAMWNAAFYDDDALNGPLAEEWGIVMGSSHHEPMMRAQKEWHRGHGKDGRGPWNFETNTEALRAFWTAGLKRTLLFEKLVTIGMRGDGDEPMVEGENVALLERVVGEQRRIIEMQTGRPPEQTPQVWALYKEVQGYYESGMRVPDDVLLLWSDDNWGNLRRLPTAEERGRAGGAGVYYHFDYVGGPRSYKWLNVTPLPKVWEQMHLAWQHGATRLWMVNVGDLKPMEVPTEFFLRYAWNPAQWPAERLPDYLRLWAQREFGPAQAKEIADLVAQYTRFNGRRKPEQLSPTTFSLVNDGEAERVLQEWQALVQRAERVKATLPASYQDAFFQLVLYPIEACATLNELYLAVARNHLHARQGRRSTNAWAERARTLFAHDAELTRRYHQDLAGGKWNHLMSQPHIGYTSWNQPARNLMPDLLAHTPQQAAQMGVMAEGSEEAVTQGRLTVPPLEAHVDRPRWVDVYNRGQEPLAFTATASVPWLTVNMNVGPVVNEQRLSLTARWADVPTGRHQVQVTLLGPDGAQVVIDVPVFKAAEAPAPGAFVEAAGVLAIEAAHTHARHAPPSRQWVDVPGHGHTLSGLTTLPVLAPPLQPADGLRLDYSLHLFNAGPVTLHVTLAPTLKFQPGAGLRYAVAFDDEAPQIVNVHSDETQATWAKRVSDGVMVRSTRHTLAAGAHTLKFWALDAGLVLQRLVVDVGGLKPSYLGPPESPRTP